MLLKVLIEKEVNDSLFNLGSDKAPGPDGFPTLFFQKAWHIIGKDLCEVVEESRRGGFIFKDFNNTFLSLIPKKGKKHFVDNLRPIYLCNALYKVISKVIAYRLK